MKEERGGNSAGSHAELSLKRQVAALAAFLAIPFAAAAAASYATTRSVVAWYPTLERPAWTPSGAVISAVWTALYALMGVSAWLTWRDRASGTAEEEQAKTAQRWFLGQLALNAAWSYAFFGLRSPLAGLAVIVPLWLSIVAWSRALSRVNRAAGWLQLPYLVWVSFATGLNGAIWWMNRDG
jgi:tryptophan-rich sensory protein